MMKKYVPFSEDEVFGSVALPEGFFGSKTSISTDAPLAPSDIPPEKEAVPIGRYPKESTLPWVQCGKQVKVEVPPNQFLGWEKVLHPSQPVTAAGQAPPACGEMKQRHLHRNSETRRA